MVRYEPFSLFDRWPARSGYDRFFERFDRMMQDAFNFASATVEPASSYAAANLYDSPEAYWIEVPLPGVKAEDLDLSVQQNVLTLKATRDWPAPEKAQPLWRGFGSGQWQQSFNLPGEIDADSVQAELTNGVLRLRLPKAPHVRPRAIKVHTGTGEHTGKVIEAGSSQQGHDGGAQQ